MSPIGAGIGYDVLGSYDPLFWSFVALSAGAAGVVLLVRDTTEVPASTPITVV
jgi:hypothetical protein